MLKLSRGLILFLLLFVSPMLLAQSYSSRPSTAYLSMSPSRYSLAPRATSLVAPTPTRSNYQSTSLGASTSSTALSKKYKASNAAQSSNALKSFLNRRNPPALPRATVTYYRSRYANNALFNRARSQNDSGARQSYYDAHPSTVIINNNSNGSSNFGLLSGLFLGSLLNNPSNAATFAHNHENDPDYQQWRQSANETAKENAQLRSQLAAIDQQKSTLTGATDPSWLPVGVPASAALSDAAAESQLPDFNICTGYKGGAYYKVAAALDFSDSVNVNLITTTGTPDIIEKIKAGACDAGFAQGDIPFDDEIMSTALKPNQESDTKTDSSKLFLETAHLVCNEGVTEKSIGKLEGINLWIPPGTGSRFTWDQFTKADPALLTINVSDALSYEDAVLKTVQGNQSCLFYMAAPHASQLDSLFNRKGLKLIAVDDALLFKSGIYARRTLSSNNYNNIIKSSFFSSNNIETVAVPVNFLISNAWRDKNAALYPKITLELMALEAQIKDIVEQTNVK